MQTRIRAHIKTRGETSKYAGFIIRCIRKKIHALLKRLVKEAFVKKLVKEAFVKKLVKEAFVRKLVKKACAKKAPAERRVFRTISLEKGKEF